MLTPSLFEPFDLGPLRLKNRIVMAPMARSRAETDNSPNELMATYYAQRASAGLIIAEAAAISADGRNYHCCAGLFAPQHVAGWQLVTDAVHSAGGRIFAQILHAGRASHVETLGHAPKAPSAVATTTKTLTREGFRPCSTPSALSTTEISEIVAHYARAARLAVAAGFDGLEIHGANGYLIDQFLKDGSNRRTDSYGGDIPNRLRFALEVIDAVTAAVPAFPVGMRISPGQAQDAGDSAPAVLFDRLVKALASRPLSYVHMVEGVASGSTQDPLVDQPSLKRLFPGPWMANNGYNRERAERAIKDGRAELVSFGRPFVANPDLPARLASDAPLAEADKTTMFGGGPEGYTDYASLT